MSRPVVIGVVVAAVVIVGGVAWWLIANNTTQNNNAAANSAVTDMTQGNKADVAISDMSFKPASIKVKKGTTVTWTNQDTVGHNVVGDDAANSTWFKTNAPTFTKDQSYSVTFNTVGTFAYHCGVHSFMKGSVQVVE